MKGIIPPTETVKGIPDGRVTVFREPLKPQLPDFAEIRFYGERPTPFYCVDGHQNEIQLPHQPGQIVYVRETWMPETEQGIPTGGYIYKAGSKPEPDGDYPLCWRSPATMPREAARLFLRETETRVERVWDMTERECIDELAGRYVSYGPGEAIGYYAEFWNRKYTKRGLNWYKNPWTILTQFERCEGEE